MYQILKDFAAPAATIIASLAAIFVTIRLGSQQVILAKEKLRFDLFERRYAVFGSIFDFYNAMVFWKGQPDQI